VPTSLAVIAVPPVQSWKTQRCNAGKGRRRCLNRVTGSGDSLSRVLGSRELQLRVVHSPELLSALQLLGGDAELLKELAELFLESCPKMLQDIRVALQKRDAKALGNCRALTHRIRGEFFPEGARETAQQSESLGRSGEIAGAEELARNISGPRIASAQKVLGGHKFRVENRSACRAADRIVTQ
jgi:hypothetical protein